MVGKKIRAYREFRGFSQIQLAELSGINVGTIRKYCIDVINELSDNSLVDTDKLNLYDKDGCIVYDFNVYVKGSGIVNGTEFILI